MISSYLGKNLNKSPVPSEQCLGHGGASSVLISAGMKNMTLNKARLCDNSFGHDTLKFKYAGLYKLRTALF